MKKEKPTKQYCIEGDQSVYVVYNPGWTEFDIHWRLECRIALMLGEMFDVKNEVNLYMNKSFCRIDLMVFKDHQPICGVEVKRSKSIINPRQYKKQLKFYQDFHKLTQIPIFYCRNFNEIKDTADKVYNYVMDNHSLKNCNNHGSK